MVRLIMGVKGSGKTKQLIELINAAAKDEAGNVVCIEPKRDMSYNIHYNIRLIDAQEYDLHSYEAVGFPVPFRPRPSAVKSRASFSPGIWSFRALSA